MGGDLRYIRRGDWNIFQLSLPPANLQAVSLQAEAAGVGVNATA
jgi:hypothetical protein